MIYLASDHAGYHLKEQVKEWLQEWGLPCRDLGAHRFDPADDYPDLIAAAAREVARAPEERRAIVFGGSGQGEAMAANRFPGVRAAVYYGGPLDIVALARRHNNANVLSLGARFLEPAAARQALRLWLDTPFPGEDRHLRRIRRLDAFPAG